MKNCVLKMKMVVLGALMGCSSYSLASYSTFEAVFKGENDRMISSIRNACLQSNLAIEQIVGNDVICSETKNQNSKQFIKFKVSSTSDNIGRITVEHYYENLKDGEWKKARANQNLHRDFAKSILAKTNMIEKMN